MPSNIRYLKYVFLGLLAVICVSIAAYDVLYGIPKQKCDEAHNWWSWQSRRCYVPIYLPTLTRRKPGEPATIDWAPKKADAPAPAKK